jgi:hypothetical protein
MTDEYHYLDCGSTVTFFFEIGIISCPVDYHNKNGSIVWTKNRQPESGLSGALRTLPNFGRSTGHGIRLILIKKLFLKKSILPYSKYFCWWLGAHLTENLEGKKSDISRVLLSQLQAVFDGSYLSGTPVTRRLKRYQKTELVKNQP